MNYYQKYFWWNLSALRKDAMGCARWCAVSLLVLLFWLAQTASFDPLYAQESKRKEVSIEKKSSTPSTEKGTTKKEEAKENPLNYGYTAPTVEELPSATWVLVKSVLILGVFLAGFLYLFRFLSKRSNSLALGSQMVRVLANVPIGPNRFLQIVDISGSIYVLGVSDHNVNLITEIKDVQTIQRIRLESSKVSHTQQPFHFTDLLQKILKREGIAPAKKEPEPLQDESIAAEQTDAKLFMDEHKKRLRDLNGGRS